MKRNVIFFRWALLPLAAFGIALAGRAETCATAAEMDAATRAVLQNTARQSFDYVARGNSQALWQNSIPEIFPSASAFAPVLEDHRENLAGASATPRNTYLLEAGGAVALERAEFFCGLFNSPNRVGFVLPNLPPGKYGLVILDVQNSKSPYFYSFLLRQDKTAWKLAGLFPHPRQAAGHDFQWYWQQARDFAAKGESHNAWFHYLLARELAAPVPFMSSPNLDLFYDEGQKAMPADLPETNPLPLPAPDGRIYQVTSLFVVPDEKSHQLNLVMRYQAADISDTAKTFQDNLQAMKALLVKYPELRGPFANLVARAVAPSGQDFGSMAPMREIR